MKSLVALAAVAAVAAVAAPASAQTLPSYLAPVTYNAGVGYTALNTEGMGLGALTLRAGADFGRYFGVEGEGAFGVVDQNPQIAGVITTVHINDQYAAYAVVRYPVVENGNLFVRGGFGHTDLHFSAPLNQSLTTGYDSWNFGAGGEYFFDGKNGVRAEYTRYDFQDRGLRDADSWTVSYVRKF